MASPYDRTCPRTAAWAKVAINRSPGGRSMATKTSKMLIMHPKLNVAVVWGE